MGLSVSLDIATRALQVQQLGVDVTAHNIANANTQGYSRQAVHFTAEVLAASGAGGGSTLLGESGRGVNASEIRRFRDQFVDFQIRDVLQLLGRYGAESQALAQAEVIVNEPTESGLGSLLANFWNSWRDLSNAPESAAARANVVAESGMLVTAIGRRHDQLRALQSDLDTEVQTIVAQINTLGAQIVDLNAQIVRMSAGGDNAGDLLDLRDLRLDDLSQLVNVTVTTRENGAISVLVGGRELVAGSQVYGLTTTPEPGNLGYHAVRWGADNVLTDVTSGKLFGLLQARDVSLVKPINDLNTLTAALITQVNAVHQTGFGLDNTTATDFFSGTDAADIAVNPTLVADANKIAAASGASLPGDASSALAIADLQQALTMNGGTGTFEDFYNSAVGRLGVSIQEARSLAQNQEFLRAHLQTLRESVACVNLDEEMTNLIKFQRAFEAAARLISVVDSMLETLINRVGLGGR